MIELIFGGLIVTLQGLMLGFVVSIQQRVTKLETKVEMACAKNKNLTNLKIKDSRGINEIQNKG